MNKTIIPGKRCGTVRIPSSKSVLHRLMICAALGRHPVVIEIDGLSKDILATARCLSASGADIRTSEKEIVIHPINQTEADESEVLLLTGESGSTLQIGRAHV